MVGGCIAHCWNSFSADDFLNDPASYLVTADRAPLLQAAAQTASTPPLNA